MEQGKYVSKGDNIILVNGENSGEVFTVPVDDYMGSTFKQLYAAKYLTYMPSEEVLRREIEQQKEMFYLQHNKTNSERND